MLFIYWNNVVLSLCYGTDLHALELIFLIEWIVDATHMSLSYHFCSILLLLSRPEAVRFLVIGILDSKLDQGSYRGSVNSKINS